MISVSPDLLEVAERAVSDGAHLDFHRRVEIVAAALQAERERCADAVKQLAKRIRRPTPSKPEAA